MTAISESANLALRLWFIIYRTHNMLKMCSDRVYHEYKLTKEQYIVLVTIKYLDSPVRLKDIARWLRRNPNSINMIVDRMVKAGLIRRVRDRNDRREVRLIITRKGEEVLKPAFAAGLEFIWKTLSPLSYNDMHTLMRLLETIQYEAYGYLNSRLDMEKIKEHDAKSYDNLMGRLIVRLDQLA